MTRKEEITKLVLGNKVLSEFGNYVTQDYEDFFNALDSDNPIISNVTKLVNGDYGNIITENDKKKVYQIISTDLQTNLTL